MKRNLLICILSFLFAAQCLGKPYQVFYYLATGNAGRQVMVVEADSPGTARRIFAQLMPKARISEIRQLTH